MGQKFSELRSLFGPMEVHTTEEGCSRRPEQRDTASDMIPKTGGDGDQAETNVDSMIVCNESVAKFADDSDQRESEDTVESPCSCPGMNRTDESEYSGRNSVPTLTLQRTSEPSTSRRTRTLSLGRRSRVKVRVPKETASKKKKNPWVFKLNYRLKGMKSPDLDIPEPNVGCDSCVCTGYRRTEEHHLGAGVVFEATPSSQLRTTPCHSDSSGSEDNASNQMNPVIDLSKFNPEDYPIEDCDERARQERAREIAEGVDPPPGFQPQIQFVYPPEFTINDLTALFQTHLGIHPALTALTQLDISLQMSAVQRIVHSQVDYIHCLVPDLLQITSCSFYWGKMDRYEAERLLEGRREGTFLLRDSAQEEFLFSVSFRKYGRSLHARIEQWNHKFSFDSHDPGVFASSTVCGLIEHYKDPSCCMFFEPMLTIPLHRNFAFPLQHLCRAVICSNTTYDGINQLCLPKALKSYLKEYHYKQRVRVRRFDPDH